MSGKPIPEDILAAEQLRYERHVAATLMEALSESGLPLLELEHKIGAREGYIQNYLIQLINGQAGLANEPVRIAAAVGLRFQLGLKHMHGPYSPKRHEDAE